MQRTLRALALFALCCVFFSAPAGADEAATGAATAADTWLKLLDNGQYADGWQQASALFQSRVDSAAWTQKVAAVRRPLGPLLSRKLVSTQTATSLAGAPEGHYVVMRYSSSFKMMTSADEVVTMMLDQSGDWRVAGYFIG
jgi:hypothetical protein